MMEIVLSVALIAILGVIATPLYRSYLVISDLNTAVFTVVQSLRRAQVLSQAVESDSSWGLKTQNESIFIFKGTSFAARDTEFDETFSVSSSVSFSGLQEVVFEKLSGLPGTTGTFVLSTDAGQSRNVVVNEVGMVEY